MALPAFIVAAISACILSSLHEDAGEIHHFAQADDAGPGHRFGHFGGADGRAGRFQARGAGDAGGHLHVDVDGQGLGFVVHQFDAGQAEDVGDFVGVDEHAGGAVGDDGAGEFGDGDHAAFDVHVGVAQAGDEVTAVSLHHFCLFPNRIVGIFADIGDAAVPDGDIGVGDDFAAVDVDPTAVFDDHRGRFAAHRHIY